MRYLISADTGGTFTDVSIFDTQTSRVAYGKTLTQYADLVQGVLAGLDSIDVDITQSQLLKHGTTYVINALLQRSGSRTALVTTRGFRDSIEIGRGNRPVPFMLEYERQAPLVARDFRFEITERMDARGGILVPLDANEVRVLGQRLVDLKVEAVAISFLNAYANPEHERAAVEILSEIMPDAFITTGTALTGEWYEYERTSTAIANAYVGGKMAQYVEGFESRLRQRGFEGALYMMGSNGGVMSIDRTLEQPITLVESGPVGGCIGAAAYAQALGISRLIAFDMGGTTAKCALISDGLFDVQPVYYFGGYETGYPLKTPVLDIAEVGAGGGSIAAVDAYGHLSVGPRSAGSEPGPVAFSRGGTEPTITDANLVLGRISDQVFLGGKLRLDKEAASTAIRTKVAEPMGYAGESAVETAAQGILNLAAATMSGAIKEITVERGLDLRDFALMVFGGGGPLFGSTLARQLRISTVIVPPHPGNFSTLGMLMAGARTDLSTTLVTDLSRSASLQVETEFDLLEVRAVATLPQNLKEHGVRHTHWIDARYKGQSHTVRVPIIRPCNVDDISSAFGQIYFERYGHINKTSDVEIVSLRIGTECDVPKPTLNQLHTPHNKTTPVAKGTRSIHYGSDRGRLDTTVWSREQLPAGFEIRGPAVIEEFSATTILEPDDIAIIGELGEIVIKCADKEGGR